MATEADLGFGTLFQTDYGSGYETLAEVNNITPPAMSRDSVEVTHEQSPNAWREKIPGLKDAGEVSLDLNMVPGGFAMTRLMSELAMEGSEAVLPRKIIFPDGSSFSFSGFLTGAEPDAPIDDKLALSVTITVTGEPVLSQA